MGGKANTVSKPARHAVEDGRVGRELVPIVLYLPNISPRPQQNAWRASSSSTYSSSNSSRLKIDLTSCGSGTKRGPVGLSCVKISFSRESAIISRAQNKREKWAYYKLTQSLEFKLLFQVVMGPVRLNWLPR